MTGEEFADALVSRGIASTERSSKARLFDIAMSPLREGNIATSIWVPGRLELFGRHTDYAGGRSILAAVPRGFVFVSAPRTDGEIVVVDAATGQSIRPAAGGASAGWPQYARVVVRRLARNFPGASGGVTISFASDLPQAAGMSSSSALVVGIAMSLITAWRLEGRVEWHEAIDEPSALATYLACIENGSDYGPLSGDAGVGTRGGSEDHVAMLLCRPHQFSAFSFMPVRHIQDAPLPREWTLVVASSGVPAEKTADAKQVYNQLADATQVLLRLWNEREAVAPSLAAALKSDPDAPVRLKALVLSNRIDGWPAEVLLRRIDHLVLENRCVDDAMDAIDTMNAEALNAVSMKSQQAAEALLRQQVPETMALAHEAHQAGAFGACSFGAGFGGSVWAIVASDDAADFGSEWAERYHRRFPERDGVMFVACPGPPVVEFA